MSFNIIHNASLQTYNTMAVSARASQLAEIVCIDGLRELLAYARQHALPIMILGEGSNSLFVNDYPGIVLLNRLKGIDVVKRSRESVQLQVASGENWHELVTYCTHQGWFGLENLALIPGLAGAAPMQNIGAYGVELQDYIISVDYIDIKTQQRITLQRADCQFAYRDSIFKHQLAGKVFIVSLVLELSTTPNTNLSYPSLTNYFAGQPSPTPEQVYSAVCAIRRSKLPTPSDTPNSGSFFKNPIVDELQHRELKSRFPQLVSYRYGQSYKLAAAWLIEYAGWKDKIIEQVCVHATQALVITNPNGASGAAVLRFAQAIQADIVKIFGVNLEIEPQLI